MSVRSVNVWIDAARPKTLPAAVTPVVVGAALAFSETSALHWPATLTALLCALLIQIGTNFANDYYDYIKGADTHERIGFERATASGLVPVKAMLHATILTMGLAFVLGLYLVAVGGWIVLVIGLASLLFGILYTGGPFPLAYNGLGDVFVFIFFGIIAVMTTYYLNTLVWAPSSFWASLAVGALCTNILVVNNLRDTDQDAKAGKKTLGVLFGENFLRIEYTLMLLMAFAVPPHFYFQLDYSAWVFLPFLAVPLAVQLCRIIWTEKNKAGLNPVLAKTAQFMILFGMLFSAGMLL